MKKYKSLIMQKDDFNPLMVEVDLPKKIVKGIEKVLDEFDSEFTIIRMVNPDENQVFFVLMDEKHPNGHYSVEIKKFNNKNKKHKV